MKRALSLLTQATIIVIIMMAVMPVNAQRRFAPLAVTDFTFTIQNDAQTASNVLEFDLYLLDTDPANQFELATWQAGIVVNSAIYNGGTLSVALVAGSSALPSNQQPNSVLWSQAQNCIKITPKAAPGSGSGTIISTTAPGTKCGRFRITNTVPFTAGAKSNLTFSFTTVPYPTKIAEYIGGTNTQLTCNATNCFNSATNIFLNAWQGGTSSDWDTPGNWNPPAVPTGSWNAYIPTGVINLPVVNSNPATNAVCNNLTINTGTSVTVAAGKALTVNGTLTNNVGTTGLVIESGGSLIHSTTGVQGTVKRYIGAWTSNNHGWHFLSSPVAAQAIQPDFVSNPPSANEDFYAWDEPTGYWINSKANTIPPFTYNTALGTNFEVGKGYLVAYASNYTKQFTGALNVTDVARTATNTTANVLTPGWNLLGNPFGSAVTWNPTTWSVSNVANVAKIWNEAGASYSDINSGIVIPPLQGFMVYVPAPPSGSLTIPAAARVHSATGWYKVSNNPYIKLVAHNPAAQTFQESIVTFDNQSAPGYDPSFDSKFLTGYAPEFYSVDGDVHLSTNVLPNLTSQTTVPLTFIKNAETDYYIEASQIENFPAQVFLTDLKLNISQNLNENPMYTFTAQAGDDPNRFLLFFTHVGIGEKGAGSDIYTYENNLYVVNPGKATVELWSLTGQKLFSRNINCTTVYQTTLDVPTAYYMVRLTTGNNVIVKKVFVKS